MIVVKKIARYSGKPYFLVEDSVGSFGVLKAFFIGKKDDSKLNFIVDSHCLELGKDLVEIPLRGQSICVEYPWEDSEFTNYDVARQVILELRNYALNCNRDFVSYHDFRGNFGAYVGKRAGMAVLRVEPRVFRFI
jgi:hypothetical protein